MLNSNVMSCMDSRENRYKQLYFLASENLCRHKIEFITQGNDLSRLPLVFVPCMCKNSIPKICIHGSLFQCGYRSQLLPIFPFWPPILDGIPHTLTIHSSNDYGPTQGRPNCDRRTPIWCQQFSAGQTTTSPEITST